MTKFKIIPISKTYADRIRQTMTDDFDHNIQKQLAKGPGPCRVSLKVFNQGIDERLVFTHSPFAVDNAYNQPGPIFINAEDVEEYADIHRFPPEVKAEKVGIPLTIIGYNDQQQMIFSRLVGDDDVDELIPQIFDSNEKISYLHARNAKACCYICRIERC